ncbi:MAG: Ig-like domain-containing protein [Bryobacterales bacterium]
MAVVRSRLVRLNLDAIDPDSAGAAAIHSVRINLFPGIDPQAQRTRSANHGRPGRYFWFGQPQGEPESDVVLSVSDGRVNGSIALREGFFRIRHIEGDLHEIAEVAYDRPQSIEDAVPLPQTAALAAPKQSKELVGPNAIAAEGDAQVDILVVYTSAARRAAGGSQTIQDHIQLAIDEANASFVSSNTQMQYRLVGMAEMNFSGSPAPNGSFLDQVTSNEPDLQALRSYYGADMVSVWVENTAGGTVGIAWLNPGAPFDFTDYGYGIVTQSYSNGPFYTFAHEGGHNLGGAHDRDHASTQGAFSYSYGYQYKPSTGIGFYTIMSYSGGCSSCSSINRWSNPDLLYNGVPTGVPQLDPLAADNAATLRQIAPSVAGLIAPQSPPPNHAPTANDQTLSAFSSIDKVITLTGSDADNDALEFEILTQPSHGSLTGSGATWTYRGDVGYSGPDQFTFEVRDPYGGFDSGTISLNVTVPASTPPSVSLAAPTGGPFNSPATINLTATATDSDGSVLDVRFYANGALIGSATSSTSSFTFAWANVTEGSYSVTAVARDNTGNTATSNAVSVTVGAGSSVGYTTRVELLHYAFNEGTGTTVYDAVGGHNGTTGGSASWTSLGLKGGWVNSGVSSFSGNKLSAVSGDAFTVLWVGKLDSSNNYQTLFSMQGSSKVHASLLYYQPNGYLYLNVNGYGSAFNAGSLFGKNVMVALRCASGICSWRVGADTWKNAAVGTTVDPSPLLLVGSDYQHYRPFTNNVSSLFWVYGDALTDAEVDANFQYAGSTLASRGASLDGYTPSSPPPSNTAPTVSLASPTGGPFTAPASINLVATASDSDGSVQKVDFLANGSLIGTATSASSTFSYNWTGVPAGDYSIVARATDNIGATTDSAPVTVSVGSASAGGPLYITRAGLLHYAFNEGTGTTVYDAVGGHNGTTAGSASDFARSQGRLGQLRRLFFSGNKLSAVSGDAFTVLWVGKLDSSNNYQTLFSMQGSSRSTPACSITSPTAISISTSTATAAPSTPAPCLAKTSWSPCAARAESVPGASARIPGRTLQWERPSILRRYCWSAPTTSTTGLSPTTSPPCSGSTATPSPTPKSTPTSSTLALPSPHAALLDGYSVLAPAFEYSAYGLARLLRQAVPSGPGFDQPRRHGIGFRRLGPESRLPSQRLAHRNRHLGLVHLQLQLDRRPSGRLFDRRACHRQHRRHDRLCPRDSFRRQRIRRWSTLHHASRSVALRLQRGHWNNRLRCSRRPQRNHRRLRFLDFARSQGRLGQLRRLFFLRQQAQRGFRRRLHRPLGRQARFVQQLPNAVLYAGQLQGPRQPAHYQPNGYLYLNVNGYGSAFNAGSLFGKNVMVALRCASGICSWRVGADTWKNAAVGTTVDPSPLLLVGSDYQHYRPFTNNVSSLFWVYGDALTDAEVDANFQYAGSTLASRGASLDGYVASGNSSPTAQSADMTIAQDRYGFVYLRGSDPDGDSLTYSVTSGPAHGTLEDTAFPFKYYQPEAGWTGTDHIQFEVRDSYGHSATGAISITVEPYQTFNTAISTADELFAKLRFARPGETVVLAPGVYTRPVFSSTDWGLRGVEQYPIVFRAQDPANPPTIDGSLVLAGSSWLRFENLRFVNPGYHNVNVYPNDAYPSHDIVFDGIYAESKPDLTLAANLKITRSDNVDVRNSTFFGWGDNSIDTIGLWGGVFEDNQFLGRSGFAQRTALQLKGDSRDLIVRNNYFFNAGQRVVQIGGGTGAQFFREPPSFEAQRVEVYGNRIVGGGACFSLATQTDSNVHHNTCYLPSIWIIRLLNENGDLEPNQNGRFEHNLFVYDSGINPEFVNLSVLGGVDVASFVFHNNAYFQVDGDSPSLPALPVVETNMVDQINPELVDAGLATMAIGSANPAFVDIGADVVNP